jgi:phytol kinase
MILSLLKEEVIIIGSTATGYILGFGYVFGIILVIGLLYKLFNIGHELARKVIHILLFYTWVILYRYFSGNIQILVIPVAFIIVNLLSYKFKLFKAIEREEDNHLGTVYFAIAITILMAATLIFKNTMPMSGIAVFCLTFGDGFASVFGTYLKPKKYIRKNKTVWGTAACFVFSFLGILLCRLFVPFEINIVKYLIIAAVSAASELVGAGLDNFSITFSVYIVSSLILSQ